ncbi:hypothetical protein HF1_06410 [Mycoplasma haemofelis str. Langford 1]|uniref:Uncharacterized protein n=2 Tax=Mycoplasma haemofelis TaxID=29501 RepID=F6FIB5_MYCHI|nr:hypothetical protein [Mycoplasma haemofelis]AEG72963.1 hypothetical protein MHF_0693 [Mycoplasma haemofelis Ohio2]CBY92649.1 hypothetical protein HF1_06410 [Mycoplasma haemofelis str. Langford 1]
MSTLLFKSASAAGVVGVSGLGGYGAYKAFSHKTTIKEAILSSKDKDDTYSFLSPDSSSWEKVKEEYEKTTSTDKPTKDGVAIPKGELPQWCASTVDSPFEGKESAKYRSITRWCYLSTNSFEKQAESKNRKLITAASGKPTPAQEWKDAWSKKYKAKKDDSSWKIDDTDVSDLNKDDEAKAATALKNWCDKKKAIFMYSEGARNEFKKFLEFCTDDKGG